MDTSTAAIASVLNPDHQVRNENFTTTDLPDGFFTAVVGNVPFGQNIPRDEAHNPGRLSLHNYFISKSIDLTATGGYVAVITSQFTANAGDVGEFGIRTALTDRADFVTGVRLPGGRHGVFADENTEVGTDLLVFRVREPGTEPTAPTYRFRELETITVGTVTERVNAFFVDRPERVIGEYAAVSGPYGETLKVLPADGIDIAQRIREVLVEDLTTAKNDGRGLTAPENPTAAAKELLQRGMIETAQAEIEGIVGTIRYHEHNGRLTFEQLDTDKQWQPVKPNSRKKQTPEEWRMCIDMRDTVVALTAANRENDTMKGTTLRTLLNDQYDRYVETFGNINRHILRPARSPAHQTHTNNTTTLLCCYTNRAQHHKPHPTNHALSVATHTPIPQPPHTSPKAPPPRKPHLRMNSRKLPNTGPTACPNSP
ncbi:hypothetical protein [Corynebacterium sp. CCM 9203]|uniref:hypothetical protein n=1 Tax=Corynebacterium sp. CCM 9203 TaxID=3057615 RepID=UPI0035240E16